MRDDHDAQDVVQEAYLRALRHYHPDTVADPRPWLLAIVRNCCFTWKTRHRVDARSVEYDDEQHALPDPLPDPEALAVAGSERDRLHRALDTLPPEFRDVLVLRELEQLSYREIADVTGVPVGTVMSRLARARRRLQRVLGAPERAGDQ